MHKKSCLSNFTIFTFFQILYSSPFNPLHVNISEAIFKSSLTRNSLKSPILKSFTLFILFLPVLYSPPFSLFTNFSFTVNLYKLKILCNSLYIHIFHCPWFLLFVLSFPFTVSRLFEVRLSVF